MREAPTLREIGEGELVLGCVDVRVEVAEHDLTRATAGDAGPVNEVLTAVFLEDRTALLHLIEHDGFPGEISEGGAATRFGRFGHTELQ